MPCYDPPMVQKEEALLCGLTDALRKLRILPQVLDNVDWEKVGLKEVDFENWLAGHDKAPKQYLDYK